MGCIERAAGALLLAAGVAIGGSAIAAPIVDVIAGEPTNVKKGSPVSFTHDLSDNGYTVGSDTITSASLLIMLTDDNGNEKYTISFGTPLQVNSFTEAIPHGVNTPFSFLILTPSLSDLSATGKIGVTIAATDCTGSKCDSYAFKFVSSTLTAQATRPQFEQATSATPTNSVPEPGTLALLGLGFAGIAALRRSRLPKRASRSE